MKKIHMLIFTISLAGTILTIAACRPKEEAPEALNHVLNASISFATESTVPLSTEPEPTETTIPETTMASDPPIAESTVESEPVVTNEQPTEPVYIAPEPSNPSVPLTVPQTEPSAPPSPVVTEPIDLSPVYTEATYQTIIDIIREYGEEKRFVWNDSLVLGVDGIGYYGRPDLTNDGYDGVISMLKFHCNKIEEFYGPCYFKVIWQQYEGNIEFIVLYA